MGYERIISWVESNFNVNDYSSYFEFEQAVRKRFNSDGIDLPKGAESQMMDYFKQNFQEGESPIMRSSTLDSYTPPDPEILQIQPEFFDIGTSSLPEPGFEVPDILQDIPQQPVQPASFFGKVSSKVSGFFRRLFRI